MRGGVEALAVVCTPDMARAMSRVSAAVTRSFATPLSWVATLEAMAYNEMLTLNLPLYCWGRDTGYKSK